MYNVLITEQLEKEGMKILEHPQLVVDTIYNISIQNILTYISKYSAIIVKTLTKVNSEIISEGKNLKCIARIGVGVDNIDVDFATKINMPVFNSPHGNTIPTAEHTIGMILYLAKRFTAGHAMVVEGKWERETYRNTQLFGKTLGIIGLGKIGKAVAKRANAFGMNVIACDPYIGTNDFVIVDAKPVTFEELIKNSDFISLHVPLNSETINMIGKKELSQMKADVILINCARGKIVNEEDLYIALKDNIICGAGIDVFSKEPPLNNPLSELNNCILTPHIASYTPEAKRQTSVELAQTVKDFLLDGIIKNCVNFDQNSFYK